MHCMFSGPVIIFLTKFNFRHKLRWVLRRALNIAQQIMKSDEKLLVELSNHVAESLHSIYPEVGKNLSKVIKLTVLLLLFLLCLFSALHSILFFSSHLSLL